MRTAKLYLMTGPQSELQSGLKLQHIRPPLQYVCCLLDPGGLEVERLLVVRKVAGSIPSRDIPKSFKDGTSGSRAYARHGNMNAWKYGWSARCQLIM